jgi:hypothetical protein
MKRIESEQVKFGMAMLAHLPRVEAPEAIWVSIEAALDSRDQQSRDQQSRDQRERATSPTGRRWRWAFAATAVALVTLAFFGIEYWRTTHPSGARWEVVRIDGAPSVASKHILGTGRIGAGEWMETDASSRAGIKVGDIGSVEVEPNTRLRVVTARPGEHRLALARGEIRAKISAPPKLFFVDTASGTAIDLGCEYALSTDEDGSGLLQVTKGWVSFQWKGLESLVPAGASCRTRPRLGPGVPYFDDAPEVLKQALENFGLEKSANDTLGIILAAARVRDTLTLWHLLSRVEVGDRARVYDRIAALTPVPAGVSREQALKLDPATLNHWKEELAWTW